MTLGDQLPVEIAGNEIGSAIISEVTEDFVEVVYMGHAIKLAPDSLNYYDLFKEW